MTKKIKSTLKMFLDTLFLIKKNLLLPVIIGITITGTSQTILATEQQEDYEENYAELQSQSQWNNFYTPTLIGGLIGVVTGKLSAYAITTSARSLEVIRILEIITENQRNCIGVAVLIIIIIAENRLRKKLTDDLIQKLEENLIEHTENSIKNTAWITSWIAFLIL